MRTDAITYEILGFIINSLNDALKSSFMVGQYNGPKYLTTIGKEQFDQLKLLEDGSENVEVELEYDFQHHISKLNQDKFTRNLMVLNLIHNYNARIGFYGSTLKVILYNAGWDKYNV